MEKELARLVSGSDEDAAYYIGAFYGHIKLSKRISTFYGETDIIKGLKSFLGFYVSREGPGYVCIESFRLSQLLENILPNVIKGWEFHSPVFREFFLKGYEISRTITMKLGQNKSFTYIKGKKRILKELQQAGDYIVQMSDTYILYRTNGSATLKEISDFDSVFNIRRKEQYKALIGIILGDGHMKKSDYIQVTHTDPQEPYIRFMKTLLDYWGISSTIGKPSPTNKFRKDGSQIINHYYYISLDNSDYFKNRVSLTNKQVNSYLAKRITNYSMLFWYLDDGGMTDYGIRLYTNGFDNLSQNTLIKYLKKNHDITAKVYVKDDRQYLHLSVEDSKKFKQKISKFMPYLPDCFKNKFEDFDNSLCII